MTETTSGFADINGAKIYYEYAGDGMPFVMIHAGIADNRMWNHEFTYFADRYKVVRYDIRGYGKSEPVDGKWNIQDDFEVLLDILEIDTPFILMGCSIGAGLAIDYAITYPDRVHTLILVGGYPRGFETDAKEPDHLFEQAQNAFNEGNLDRATEIDTQIWVDGVGRTRENIDADVRQFAFDMNRIAMAHEAKKLGQHVRKEFDQPATECLLTLHIPTLVLVGDKDLATIIAAADYMNAHLPNSTQVTIPNAAHLPNLEKPVQFRQAIESALKSV